MRTEMKDDHISEETKKDPILVIKGLSKKFTSTIALNRVDFEMYPGEIHALVGENGAGKSTLIKFLARVPQYEPDEGEVWIHGRKVESFAQPLPISFIHQDLGLIESMTVAENIALVLGYQRRHGLISWRETQRAARGVLKTMGSTVNLNTVVSSLPSSEKSIVAISRALAAQKELLVLDEPTATLPENDVVKLFEFLTRLRDRGIGIIYVSHRIDEIYRIADRVTVLRNGKKVSTTLVKETTPQDLVLKIVGRPPAEVFIKPPPPSAHALLEVKGFSVGCVRNISFSLRSGEILGMVGLRGAGHQDIGRALYGALEERYQGTVSIQGEQVSIIENPGEAKRAGIGFLSSKRQEESLAPSLFVRENIYLNPIKHEESVMSWISKREERKQSNGTLERFAVVPRDGERIVSTLSGGNQQKVILARLFETGCRILILEEPTFGVDIGAKADIYALMEEGLGEGRAVLLISSDFEEVAGICHRAVVLQRGAVTAEVSKDELSIQRLTSLASGIVEDETGCKTASFEE